VLRDCLLALQSHHGLVFAFCGWHKRKIDERVVQPVIDLHSHILPGIDDGARDLSVSLAMAKMSVADGISVVACTPHILPGLYQNSGPQIRQAVADLQRTLDQEGIPLQLVVGADIHMVPDCVPGLQSGHLLPLADTQYVLVEPPHHVAPPRLEEFFFGLLVAGYIPILTHPERLTWIEGQYPVVQRLVQAGVWMQITAGSVAGRFGRRAQSLAHRMLDEGCVHILATDAHDTERRPPLLGEARDLAATRVGAAEAEHLVLTRPLGILNNETPGRLPMPALSSKRVAHGELDRRGTSLQRSKGAESISADGRNWFTDRLRRFFD
jgi:protein-tyrosine phosphatase